MRRNAILRSMRVCAAACVMSLALVACQAVPNAGPVYEGLTDLNQADQPVQFNPGGPMLGASQEDIVRGFISAAASSTDDYAIAREFLVPAYADEWDPSLGVLVDEGTQEYRSAGEDIGVLSLSAIAAVNARGELQPVSPGAATEVRFEFAQIDGEWRIASAPSGIILDKSTFAAVWTPLQLYFLSADNRLVPDTRWFLNRAAISTQLVGELLAGPSEQTIEVLHSAIPTGTSLAAGAVPVVDGTARIDLTAELLDADQGTMALIKQQLGASLQAVPDVARFELLVNGSVVESGPVVAPENPSPAGDGQYALALADGVFGPVIAGQVSSLPGIGSRIEQMQPTAVAVSPGRDSAAVLHQGIVSWVSTTDQVQIDLRNGLLAPSLDRFGYVWSYASETADSIVVTRPGGRTAVLPMPWLSGRIPQAVRVSPSGTRIAVLVKDAAQPDYAAVIIAGVVRDAQGDPLSLTETSYVALWVMGAPVDLDWIDEQRFVSITRNGVSGKITQGVLGQFSVESGSVPGAVTVSGGGSRSLLRVLDDDGRLFAPQGSGWQRQLDDILLLAKTG